MYSLKIIVNAVAVINSLILFSFLTFRRNNSLPNYAIAGIMIIPAIYFINSILMLNGYGNESFILFFFVQYIAIFYTPLISIYIYLLIGKKIKKLWFIFLISFLIGIIPVYIFIDFLKWEELQQITFFSQLINGNYPNSITFYSIVFYIFFDILIMEYLILPAFVTIIYTFIVYYAFRNNVIFTEKKYKLHLKLVKENTITTHFVDNKNNEDIKEKILVLLHNKDILVDTELTIGKFAKKLKQPNYIISKIINTSFNQNFYDFINSKRIKYAKELLVKEPNYKIEAIAYDVGFNSRATFYRAFKKHTNITPSQYLKEVTKS